FYGQRGSLRFPGAERAFGVAAHLEDMERLRAELRLERMKLAAHSMGTFPAMRSVQQHADRVANLALLGALPPYTPATREDSALASASDSAFNSWRQRPEVEAAKRLEGLPLSGEL